MRHLSADAKAKGPDDDQALRPRRSRFALPALAMGVPVSDGPHDGVQSPRQRGIALLIAIMIVSVMMLFTTDLIVSSQVNVTLATTHRDNLKAEYMAKSAYNIGLMLISADLAIQLSTIQATGGAGGAGGKCQLIDSAESHWSALNGFPIGGDTADMISSFQESLGLSAVLDSSILEQLKLFDGTLTFYVTDEAQKINVNNCVQGRCQETLLMLEALFSCPAEKSFLEQKKVSGKEIAYRIKDFVDTDSRPEEESGFNDEDAPYLKREPRVRAKNAPLDVLDELRMIEGWDDEMQAVFAPYLTVYPWPKGTGNQSQSMININTVSRALMQCLFPESKGECTERSGKAFLDREKNRTALTSDKKSIEDVLKDSFCYSGGADAQSGEAANRAKWMQQMSTVFRIEANGVVGEADKKLTAVVERAMPDPQKKEKASFKLLYWRLK